jgi:hypothetical protein
VPKLIYKVGIEEASYFSCASLLFAVEDSVGGEVVGLLPAVILIGSKDRLWIALDVSRAGQDILIVAYAMPFWNLPFFLLRA